MSDLLLEIVIYLLLAGIVGFVVGWMVRGADNKKSTEEVSSLKESEDSEPTEKAMPSNLVLLTQAREEGKDKLSLLKGIGLVLEGKLNQLGIYHFDQIASWNTEEQAWIGVQILFPKKVEREEWVKQAKGFSKNS
jgi:predicted flap endonuclease-1-like 5' DNA nuclease